MIALLIALTVVLAVRVPAMDIVCAAALEMVPLVVPVRLTPVAAETLHATPTWLAGTEIV